MLVVALEEKRNDARLQLMQLLYSRAIWDQTNCPSGLNATHCHAWMWKLKLADMFPKKFGITSLERIIQRIHDLESPEASQESAACDQYRWHRKPEWRLGLTEKLDEVKNSAGICLDSLRSGATVESR